MTLKKEVPHKSRKGSKPSLTVIASILVLVVVIGGALFTRFGGRTHSAVAAIPDHETHQSLAGPMPKWLVSASAAVNDEYAWAASHHNELQYFPCFCGCFESVGHVSNSDCYYKRDTKGAIKGYDQHGYG